VRQPLSEGREVDRGELPSIGRIVHFFSAANGEPGEVAKPKAAIVIAVIDNEGDKPLASETHIGLVAFDIEGPHLHYNLPFNPSPAATLDQPCWRWPVRV
jgi:hypothetical protein